MKAELTFKYLSSLNLSVRQSLVTSSPLSDHSPDFTSVGFKNCLINLVEDILGRLKCLHFPSQPNGSIWNILVLPSLSMCMHRNKFPSSILKRLCNAICKAFYALVSSVKAEGGRKVKINCWCCQKI